MLWGKSVGENHLSKDFFLESFSDNNIVISNQWMEYYFNLKSFFTFLFDN